MAATTTTTPTPRRHRRAQSPRPPSRRRPPRPPEATEPEATEPEATEPEATEPTEPTEILTDFGVTDDTIRIGLNADLSGIFAPLVTQIVDGQEAYWEIVNENGGIAGRQVELVVLDNALRRADPPRELRGDGRRER